jgi:hypothetical protein
MTACFLAGLSSVASDTAEEKEIPDLLKFTAAYPTAVKAFKDFPF